MSEWETLKREEVEAGGNNFIEITLKRHPERDNLFVGISKGWTTDDGQKRYKTNILFTRDKTDSIVEAISKVARD